MPASCFPHAEHTLVVHPCSALAASVPPAVPLAGVAVAVLGVVLSVSSPPWLAARCAAPALATDEDLAATLLLSTSSPVAAAAVQEMHLRLAASCTHIKEVCASSWGDRVTCMVLKCAMVHRSP